MTSTARPARTPGRPLIMRLSAALHARPRLRLAGLLSVPLLWLLVAYLGSLAVLLTAAFWSVDSFTGELVKVFTLDNLRTLLTEDVYRTIALRTLGIAVAVTVLDGLLGLPMAFFMAKVASRRARVYLVVAVLTPLWASYLVKAYAWRVLLSPEGL